jgi:hypothetical protein
MKGKIFAQSCGWPETNEGNYKHIFCLFIGHRIIRWFPPHRYPGYADVCARCNKSNLNN